jgi:Fe-S cluster assembly iron-binding protein IscA
MGIQRIFLKGGEGMLKVTARAAQELRDLIAAEGGTDTLVRLYLAGMG